MAGAAALLWFLHSAGGEVPTLPSPDEVEAIRAILRDEDDGDVRFPVPREKWPAIFDALTPAAKDDHPLTWQWMGTLVITKRSGRSVIVGLFYLGEGQGAFRIEARSGPVYYRGGDSVKLEAALRSAHDAPGER